MAGNDLEALGDIAGIDVANGGDLDARRRGETVEHSSAAAAGADRAGFEFLIRAGAGSPGKQGRGE